MGDDIKKLRESVERFKQTRRNLIAQQRLNDAMKGTTESAPPPPKAEQSP